MNYRLRLLIVTGVFLSLLFVLRSTAISIGLPPQLITLAVYTVEIHTVKGTPKLVPETLSIYIRDTVVWKNQTKDNYSITWGNWSSGSVLQSKASPVSIFYSTGTTTYHVMSKKNTLKGKIIIKPLPSWVWDMFSWTPQPFIHQASQKLDIQYPEQSYLPKNSYSPAMASKSNS